MKELAPHTYTFAEYELDLARRLFLRAGQSIPLNAKTFDLLVVLIENRERVLAKEELMNLVWRDQFVEEANLTVQISALRKALGEKKDEHRFIVTLPGRGYRFVADVQADASKSEIVIETQTTSCVVVEEEVVTEPHAGEVMDGEWLPPQNNESALASYNSESRLQQASIANLTARQVVARVEDQVRPVNRLSVVLLSIALGLLLLAGVAAAVWLYQARRQSRQSAASLPPKQMTIRGFTTHGGVPVRVAISPDGKTLVYRQRLKGEDSLWLGQIETNTSLLIYQQPGLRFNHLVFTPDGGSIYFNVSGANRPAMLARMSILGGAITELIPRVDSPVTFAPDGKQMAFLKREDGETKQTSIIIAAADGQNQRTLITLKEPESFSSDGLSWSPDGKNIAFSAYNASRQEEAISVSVADGRITRIGSRDWGNVSTLTWLADGSGVLVLARETVGERIRRIWLVSYPDGEAHLITNELNVFLQDSLSVSADGKLAVLQGHVNAEIWIAPQGEAKQARRVLQGVAPRYEGVDGLAWTPDGRLLYTANVGAGRVIWSMNSDGSDLRQLTSNLANSSDGNMCVSGDGRYVVFQSNRSGATEIWRVNSDGGNLKQLTSGGHNSLPSLSPDGQWVIYDSGPDGQSTLRRISIDGSEAAQIAGTSCSAIQVSPDGHYIACLEWSPERLLIIPFAGGEPVKSFPAPGTASQGRPRLLWMPDGKSIIYKDDVQGLWRQALDGEKPEMIKGFEELRVRQLAWSFDGKNLAYTSGPTTHEIVLIENFK